MRTVQAPILGPAPANYAPIAAACAGRSRHPHAASPPPYHLSSLPLADKNPKLAAPTVKALDIRVMGCGASQVDVDRVEVQAGLLRVVQDKSGATEDIGIPRRIRIAVLPQGAPKPRGACSWPLRGSIDAGATRSYNISTCSTCGFCLQRMQFKCSATYRVRVLARGRGTTLEASDWSQDFEWKAACSGNAGIKCYV
jgi:hypothetical protein